jgi:hypothetical protein
VLVIDDEVIIRMLVVEVLIWATPQLRQPMVQPD